mmetsp:Transcript_70088/g.200845  ORF Transcript_70088/g.200845 Transcript_70088/m.200845 type:complete len:394 (+) Transcript_70088:99-1280(+)
MQRQLPSSTATAMDMPMTSCAGVSDNQVQVMDGSMGRLCMLKGIPEDDKLWSARGLVEEQYHEIIIEAHMEYIQAGSVMITTNNYAVQPNYYRRVFDDWQARIASDTETAARLAVEARRRCHAEGSVRILGSLPPICESHRPDLTALFIEEEGEAACLWYYRTIGEALRRGGVDALLAETMNSWDEARLAIEATKDLGLPLLISMEGALRDEAMKPHPHLAGDIAEKVLRAKSQGAPIEALGFNCAPPEAILMALQAVESSGVGEHLRQAGIKLAAYANCNDRKAVHDAGFDVLKFVAAGPIRVREDLKGTGYVGWCHRFMAAGATYCGGCCGCTPVEIRQLAETLTEEEPHASLSENAAKLLSTSRNDASVSTTASESELRGSIQTLFGTVI